MIQVVREPVDEFGRRLRELRKARQVTAAKLSRELRRHPSYISGWERDQSVQPTAETIVQISEALSLTKPECAELSRLATLRGVPEAAREHILHDPDANLLRALLEVEHDWPSEPDRPNPHSERAQPLIDAAAWALAEIAAVRTELLAPFSRIRWPEPLRRLGIVPDIESADAIEPPVDLVKEELPFVDRLAEPVTNLDAFSQSLGMARVYRRLLFSAPHRTRQAVQALESWKYDRSQALLNCASLRFTRLSVHEMAGVQDVDAGIIASVAMRSLACYLWTAGRTREKKVPWWCDYEPVDAAALMGFVTPPEDVWNYGFGNDVRSGIYVMRSRIWSYVLAAIRRRFGIQPNSQPELERQLKRVRLDDDARKAMSANPWVFAGVDPKVLLTYARALEAAIPPPDEHILWKPGEPYPEGHPFWKPGETTLVDKNDAPASMKESATPKPKPRTRAKTKRSGPPAGRNTATKSTRRVPSGRKAKKKRR